MNASILDFLEKVLKRFRACFSRGTAWAWFAVLVMGFMLRADRLGVTSVVRDLALAPAAYDAPVHFFRATSWGLDTVRKCWWRAVADLAPLHREADGRVVPVGDGVKQAKEARRMPGVKRLHQESEDSSKAEYIFGHMSGGLGVLAGRSGRFVCVPLCVRLHDGLRGAAGWIADGMVSTAGHVVRMIGDACAAARVIGDAVLVLDRHFLTRDALETLRECNRGAAGNGTVQIVTRAKMSCVAYEKPGPRPKGRRGAPRRKGAPVRLKELFDTGADRFTKAAARMYGEKVEVEYLCVDLLRGMGPHQEPRFVPTGMTRRKGTALAIFASTDLTLDPVRIIELYPHRFTIECCFRELKQQIGAFHYRFWTRSLEKPGHFMKKDGRSPLEKVVDEDGRGKVPRAAGAIEMHVLAGCIAMGILQCVTLRLAGGDTSAIRYQRTPPGGRISEAALMAWLRRHFFRLLLQRPDSCLNRIILERQAYMPDDITDGDSRTYH